MSAFDDDTVARVEAMAREANRSLAAERFSYREPEPMQQAYAEHERRRISRLAAAEQADGLRECPRHPGVEMVRVSIGVMHLDGSPSEPLVGWACARCNRGRSFVVER